MRPRDLIVTFNEDGSVLARSASQGVGVRAPAFAVGVLAECSQPRESEEVARRMGPVAAQVFAQLADAGLLLPPEQALDAPVIFHNYAGVEVHRRMLADEPRLVAYREALKAVVRPDDVVIDAGSGSGVLATYAALAGARKVYAIERTDFGRVIQEVARASGVGDRVEVVQGDFGRVQLPEKARVLVTETFGHLAISEGMMPDVAACVERNMVDDPVLVPYAFSLHLAPLARAPADLLGPFSRRADGLDLTPLRQDAAGRAMDRPVSPGEVGAVIDLGTWSMPNDGRIKARFTLDAPCDALAAWFTLHLAEGIDLRTGPADPLTHWHQSLLAVGLEPGEHELVAGPAPEDARNLLVDISGAEVRVR